MSSKRKLVSLLDLIAVLAMMAIASGCAEQRMPGRLSEHPVAFPDETNPMRVLVYGDLTDYLPSFDATPTIDRFLYGPNDYGKTALRNPGGMILCGTRLLVCDQGQQDVVAIDVATGKSMLWCDPDHRPRCPVDIVADVGGRIFVADTTSRSVLVYDVNGGFREELTPDPSPARRFRPCAVRANGSVLYVGDVGNRRVERFDLVTRQWLPALTPPPEQGGLIAPVGLAVAGDGTLLIADGIRGTVFRVTSDGRWLEPIGRSGRGPGEFVRPKQVCSTPEGIILVSDAGRQSVLVFDREGRFVTEVHERADRWRGWTLPTGLLAVSPSALASVEHAGDAFRPSSYVIVSDALGGESLTLLGIVTSAGGGTDAK